MIRILLIILGVVLAVAAGIGGTLGVEHFIFHTDILGGATATHSGGTGKEKAKPPAPPKPDLFATLDNVIASIPDEAGDPPSSYLVFAIQFVTTDQKYIDDFNEVQPMIRAKVLSLLMAENGTTIRDPKVEAKLSSDALDAVNQIIIEQKLAKTPGFTKALITNLVTQN